jgi:hypothetical protein
MSSQTEFQNAQTMREQTQKAISMQQPTECLEECKRDITRKANMGRNSTKCHKNMFAAHASQYFERLGFVLKTKPESDLVKVSWSNTGNDKENEERIRQHVFKSTWDPDYWTLDKSLPEVKCKNW